MTLNPLQPEILFTLGPIAISRAVATTWLLIAALTIASWLGLRHAQLRPNPVQTVFETLVLAIKGQIEEVLRRDATPYLPLLGTLFIFIVVSNLSGTIPGLKAPTARLETAAALAAIVFFSVHYFGIRARGLKGYLAHYTRPSILLLPLNVLEEFTRVFSLMVRLFGNIMSHELIIAIIVSLAGLFVPIPFMILGLLIGIIQAYIFTILAAVFIGAGLHPENEDRNTATNTPSRPEAPDKDAASPAGGKMRVS